MQGMRWIPILLMTGTLLGQTGQVGQIIEPPVAILPYPSIGPSISLVDNNGSLVVFDTAYTYARPAADQRSGRVTRISPVVTTVKTKLTIIPTDQTLRSTTQEYLQCRPRNESVAGDDGCGCRTLRAERQVQWPILGCYADQIALNFQSW